VTEAENNDGVQYEQTSLADSLKRIDSLQMVGEIGEGLLADLDNFRIGAPAMDDTTLLVIGLG
jgi:serine phosphatase RsbU (regulator of sigma subunit)